MTAAIRLQQSSPSRMRLATLLAALGDELRQAQADARTDGKPDVLRVKECTVELAIEWSIKGDAELDVWVVKLGGDVTKTNRDTITVRLEAIDSQMIAALR